MNQAIVNIFTALERIGLVDVLLPFILVFVIVFGILERTLVLGKDKRNANAIVAVAMAFMVVAVVNYTRIINDIARFFGLLVVMVIAFALIYGLFGRDLKFIKKKEKQGGGSGKTDGKSPGSSGKSSSSKDYLGRWDPNKDKPFEKE